MKSTISKQIIGTGLIVAMALVFLGLVISQNQVYGSAPSGLKADLATTSQISLTTTAISLMATSSCSARVVSTTNKPIMLTFSDYAGQTPTGVFGVLQAASTTVVYDSGQYGCGLVKGISFDATSNITVIDVR